eukprot:6473256-Amphidinium_carterae.1
MVLALTPLRVDEHVHVHVAALAVPSALPSVRFGSKRYHKIWTTVDTKACFCTWACTGCESWKFGKTLDGFLSQSFAQMSHNERLWKVWSSLLACTAHTPASHWMSTRFKAA